MATVAAPPAAAEAAAARVSSMTYADLYGAADDTGPSSAVAGSFGYVAATEATPAPPPPPAALEGPLAVLAGLLDTPAGVAFLIAGALLLMLWHDLAE